MADQREFREFKAGDGLLNFLPDENVILYFACADCGGSTSVAILGASSPSALDCNEPRRCVACQKKSLIGMLREFGCTIPDERLLNMSIDGLLSLAGTPEGRG